MELVVGASQATMKAILGKLGDLLAREYAVVRGVRGDIQYINDELASMQAFLVNLGAAGGDDHDAQTRDWMKQVRDIAYDIEDCIDDLIRRLPDDPRASGCLAKIRMSIRELWTCCTRRDIAGEIADLKNRAQHVGERRTRYGVKNPESSGSGTAGRSIGFDAAEDQLATAQLIGTKEPVGMDNNKELDKWVTDTNEETGVLSISGFGGVGKTTIAKALYHKYGDQFDRRAVVTVSQGSDVDAVLKDILDQVKPHTTNHKQEVSHGTISNARHNFLKIILCPVKLCFRDLKQRGGNNIGSLEEKDQVVRTCDIEQQDINVRDGSRRNYSAHRLNRIHSNLGSRSVHKGRGDRGSLEEKNQLMQWTHSYYVGDKRDSGSNNGQGNSEEKTFIALFRNTLVQALPCAGYSKQHDRRSKHGELVDELKVHLGNNRYLLLIDDIWSATTWQNIKFCLPKVKNGSKIIVTTRFQAVAKACNQNEKSDKVHTIKTLDSREAAILFERVVSESRITKAGQKKKNEKPPDRIWEICGGLPLAIVAMAGHVACNPHRTRKKWNDVCKSLFPDTLDTRFGKHQSDTPNPEEVTKILNYCYNDLPADVKTCSLYLSIFPKGFKISRKRLTRRWVAEGFVSEKQGLSEEDVAEAYFNHLIRRKIIRPVEHSINGKVKTCQVHDMVLEYIVSKSNEENLTTVIGGHWLVPMHSNKVRRLSLQSIDPNHAKAVEKMNLSRLRSLSVFGSLSQLPSHSFKIGLVQVLDLEGCTGFEQKHIKEISKLLLLKYLSLRRTDIDKIPQNIGKLQYLETLDIRETNVEQLPQSIGQLNRMINILGGNKITRKGLKLADDIKNETMKALRILSGIEIVEGSTILADPHNFTGLKKLVIYKLGIYKDKDFEDLLSAIQYLGGYSLRSLTIDDECSDFFALLGSISTPPKNLHALELSGRLLKLPDWISVLNDLNKLTLSVTALRTDTFELLKNLPHLFSLTFSLRAEKYHTELVAILERNKLFSDGVIVILQDGFQSLKLLRFSAPILPLLSFSENAMPKLERLELRFRMLEGLLGMENLKSLQEVHLRVNDKTGETTSLIIDDLITAAKEFTNKPRIIRDEYYDLLE